jgi:hypothetical protein
MSIDLNNNLDQSNNKDSGNEKLNPRTGKYDTNFRRRQRTEGYLPIEMFEIRNRTKTLQQKPCEEAIPYRYKGVRVWAIEFKRSKELVAFARKYGKLEIHYQHEFIGLIIIDGTEFKIGDLRDTVLRDKTTGAESAKKPKSKK